MNNWHFCEDHRHELSDEELVRQLRDSIRNVIRLKRQKLLNEISAAEAKVAGLDAEMERLEDEIEADWQARERKGPLLARIK